MFGSYLILFVNKTLNHAKVNWNLEINLGSVASDLNKLKLSYSQWMFKEIRLETDGGTELLAIQRYEPISFRAILLSFKVSPRNDATAKWERNVLKISKGKQKLPPSKLLTMSFRAHGVFKDNFCAILTPPSHNWFWISFTSELIRKEK